MPDGVAGKTWDAGFGFRVLASAKSYSHSLNLFLLEKAVDLRFLVSGLAFSPRGDGYDQRGASFA
jgi:hypothetical protein